MARLDVALNAGKIPLGTFNPDPVSHGFFVELDDGWEGTFAKFSFHNADLEDNPDSVLRTQYRATYRGDCFVQLTIPATTYRQSSLKLTALLDGALPREEYSVKP